MKIISLIKKYQLIIFLFFLIILLSWLKIRYGSKENNNGNEEITKEEIIIKTTPTVLPGKADILSNEIVNDGNPDFPLAKKLPYYSENFSVLDYIKELTLYVEIKNGSSEEVTKEVEAWIKEINPNIEKHEIIFKD